MCVVAFYVAPTWWAARQTATSSNAKEARGSDETYNDGPSQLVGGTPDHRPNIVLINLDDADRALFSPAVLKSYLPNMSRLVQEGLSFNNCHVTTPLCGPSRTCLLYSQHAHRTGVRANRLTGMLNNGYEGGYGVLQRAGNADQHLGQWLQDAGYRTLAVGKYLHDLPNDFAAPGWDAILMARGDRYEDTFFSRTRQGELRHLVSSTMDYFRTDFEAAEVESLVQLHQWITAHRRKPFFLYVAPMAPHEPATGQSMIAARHQGIASESQLPMPPSFDEVDFSDKSEFFQRLAPLGKYRTSKAEKTWQRRIEALVSVDEQLGRMQDALMKAGELDNTVLLLTSDHGYLLGHHRMFGKQVPFNRVTNVPLIVWSSEIAASDFGESERVSDALISQLDIAPTLMEIVGSDCPRSDGDSFAELLKKTAADSARQSRGDLLIENFERKRVFDNIIQCAYVCLRTQTEVYVRWANGACEYYDLELDPEQLDNAWDRLNETQVAEFERRLRVARCPSPEKAIEPVVTLARATQYEPFSEGFFEIGGLAEDDVAVQVVRVTIEHPQTGQFFNGTQWQKTAVSLNAELGNPGGILSTWQYNVPTAQMQGGDRLKVIVQVENGRGQSSSIGPRLALAPVSKNAQTKASETSVH